MRSAHLVPFLLLAACAAPSPRERVPAVPLGPPAPKVELRDGPRADADRSPPVPAVEVPGPVSTTVTWRTVTETIEVPVPAAADPVAGERPYWPAGYGAYDDPYWRVRHRPHGYWFPVGTVVGAGVGSVIGRHHGYRGRGAWIGGSLGLIWDLGRLWR